MQYLVGFLIGLIIGGFLMLIITRSQRKEAEKSFSLLSQEALRNNSGGVSKNSKSDSRNSSPGWSW